MQTKPTFTKAECMFIEKSIRADYFNRLLNLGLDPLI